MLLACKYQSRRIALLRFHTVVFPLCSVPGTAISSGNELLRLITLISAGQALPGNQVKSLRLLPSGADCYAVQGRKQRREKPCGESFANKPTGGDDMEGLNRPQPTLNQVEPVYKVVGYENGKRVGFLKDHTGKVMVFGTRKEAETTANIESIQIENLDIEYKIVRAKRKAGKK